MIKLGATSPKMGIIAKKWHLPTAAALKLKPDISLVGQRHELARMAYILV